MIENIALLVLNTGENLMGTIKETTDEGVLVENIVAFAPKPDGTGVMTIPYMQFSVEKETIFKESGLRHPPLTPNHDLKKYYNEQFDKSQIIVPDNNLMKPKMMGVD